MKLLLDQNLSYKLVLRLADLYPESTQARLLGFARARDSELWDYARTHGFVLVTKDEDLPELGILRGAPPKIVWLRMGNCATNVVERVCGRTALRLRRSSTIRIESCSSCSADSFLPRVRGGGSDSGVGRLVS